MDFYICLSIQCSDVLFWLKYVKKIPRIWLGKWGIFSYFMILWLSRVFFFDNILKFKRDSFLQISCNVESKTWRESTHLSSTNGFFTHMWLILCVCVCVCVIDSLIVCISIWKIIVHWMMQIFQILLYVFMYFKIPFINITTDLIRKVFKYWQAIKLTGVDMSFPKFLFSLESSNFIIGNHSFYCFPWSDSLATFIFEKISAKYPNLNTTVYLSFI